MRNHQHQPRWHLRINVISAASLCIRCVIVARYPSTNGVRGSSELTLFDEAQMVASPT
jgi:hypothetical protein